MSELIQNMIAQGVGCDVTKRIVRPDGEVRYLRCVGVPNLENGELRNMFGTEGHQVRCPALKFSRVFDEHDAIGGFRDLRKHAFVSVVLPVDVPPATRIFFRASTARFKALPCSDVMIPAAT